MARKKPTVTMSAMTYNGAATLFKFYKERFGVELIKDRFQHEDGVQWSFTMTDPFIGELDLQEPKEVLPATKATRSTARSKR